MNDFDRIESVIFESHNAVGLTKFAGSAVLLSFKFWATWFMFVPLLGAGFCAYLITDSNGNWLVWCFGFLGYILSTFMLFIAWDEVLRNAYGTHYKISKYNPSGRPKSLAYLRFSRFKELCQRAGFDLNSDQLDRLAKYYKSEREYLDVEWGVADFFRKVIYALIYSLFALWPFLFLASQEFRRSNYKFIADADKFITDFPLLAIIILVVAVCALFLVAVFPVREKRKHREMLMFLVWWKEREHANSPTK